jgi:DNA polymerase-1
MHYALRGLQSDGAPTSVVYGAVKTIHALREKVSRRMIFCWDHGVPVPGAERPHNWREQFMPTYKATRKHDDGERRRALSQFPDLFKVITWLGYGSVSVTGLEADDVIGILTAESNSPVLIYSTDKDFYQLLDSSFVQVLVPKRTGGQFHRIGAPEVEREYGVPISRWAEYLALGGDSSDNIKPRRGMGPKTAARLVQEGARLDSTFEQQFPDFRTRHEDLKEIWHDIQKSYAAARIPSRRNDARFPSSVRTKMDVLNVSPEQHWDSSLHRSAAEENFVHFCADREMTTLIALRRALFQSTVSEQQKAEKCQIPFPTNPKPNHLRNSKRSLPQRSILA